ncbi:MAG: RNA polymerase sigma factor [Pseudomarimonas sp.]
MAITRDGEKSRNTPAKARTQRMSTLKDADYQRAYRYAMALCGDRDMAYDVVHNAVANWLHAAPKNVAEPLGYFLRIVRNCFIADGKRAAMLRWTPLDDVAGVIATDMAPLEETFLQRAQLQRIWVDLGAAEREVLYLWAVEGFTIEEIAQQTATPKGTLLTRLHRLRKRFAEPGPLRAAGEM